MKKQGFTLIELLAVIVILAVIALIATPLITNTINNARKNADRESARSYVSTVEEKITEAMLEYPNLVVETGPTNASGNAVREWACTNCGANNKVTIDFKGTAPTKATLKWNAGKISGTLLYTNGCWTVAEDGTLTEVTSASTDAAAKTFCELS